MIYISTFMFDTQTKIAFKDVKCLFYTLTYIFHNNTYYPRGDSMSKANQEKLNQKKSKEKFNSITQKVKPENQNQTHNIRSEAVEPKNRQV